MSNSDWYGAAAFVGLIVFALLVGALISDWSSSRGIFEYHDAKQEQGRAKDYYCKPIGGAASKHESSHAKQNSSADDPEQKRYDLCQQWRMAQAAEKTVEYAGRQTLIGWVSVALVALTTAFAGFAAWYAREAARHTRRQADTADDVFQGAERPWLSLEFQEINHFTTFQLTAFGHLKARIENVGRVPATNIFSIGRIFQTDREAEEFVRSFSPSSLTNDAVGYSLFPGDEVTPTIPFAMLEILREEPEHPLCPTVAIVVAYRSPVQGSFHVTTKSIDVRRIRQKDMIAERGFDWGIGPTPPELLIVTENHTGNIAT